MKDLWAKFMLLDWKAKLGIGIMIGVILFGSYNTPAKATIQAQTQQTSAMPIRVEEAANGFQMRPPGERYYLDCKVMDPDAIVFMCAFFQVPGESM